MVVVVVVRTGGGTLVRGGGGSDGLSSPAGTRGGGSGNTRGTWWGGSETDAGGKEDLTRSNRVGSRRGRLLARRREGVGVGEILGATPSCRARGPSGRPGRPLWVDLWIPRDEGAGFFTNEAPSVRPEGFDHSAAVASRGRTLFARRGPFPTLAESFFRNHSLLLDAEGWPNVVRNRRRSWLTQSVVSVLGSWPPPPSHVRLQ